MMRKERSYRSVASIMRKSPLEDKFEAGKLYSRKQIREVILTYCPVNSMGNLDEIGSIISNGNFTEPPISLEKLLAIFPNECYPRKPGEFSEEAWPKYYILLDRGVNSRIVAEFRSTSSGLYLATTSNNKLL